MFVSVPVCVCLCVWAQSERDELKRERDKLETMVCVSERDKGGMRGFGEGEWWWGGESCSVCFHASTPMDVRWCLD